VEDSTTYQYVLRLGGMKVIREMLVTWGRDRFGRTDKATKAALEDIKGIDRLKRMCRKTLRAGSWEEVLRTR
jgi:hypothetical protein